MLKKLIPVFVLVGIVIGVSAYVFTLHPESSNKTSNQAAATTTYKQADACDLFPLTKAIAVLSQDTTVTNVANTNESTSEVGVTMCTYNNADTSTTATVLVRSGLTSRGVTTNKSGYDQTKSTDTTAPVSGLGDEAYYDSTLGQLSVIQGNNWLLVTSGGLMPQDHSQSEAMHIAKDVLANL